MFCSSVTENPDVVILMREIVSLYSDEERSCLAGMSERTEIAVNFFHPILKAAESRESVVTTETRNFLPYVF